VEIKKRTRTTTKIFLILFLFSYFSDRFVFDANHFTNLSDKVRMTSDIIPDDQCVNIFFCWLNASNFDWGETSVIISKVPKRVRKAVN
jgi:hypothetical protein